MMSSLYSVITELKGNAMIRTRNVALCVVVLMVGVVAFFGCKKPVPQPEPDGGHAHESKGEVSSDSSTFEAGFKIAAGGKPIDVEIGHLVPDLVDWNNDGKKDLVVGQFKEGAIRLYLNEGTDAKPVFGEFSLLAAGDKPIKLDAG